MAKYNSHPDDDMYDEPPHDADPREGEGGEKPEESEGQTATIPKSLVPGDVAVGEEIVLKVDQITEQELVVSYAPHKEPHEEGMEPGEEPAMQEGGGYMD